MMVRAVYILVLLIAQTAFGQTNNQYKYEIELGTDNDFLIIYTGTDRYYTYGINGAFRWLNNDDHFISKQFKQSLQSYSEINVNVEAYTPDYLSDGSIDPNEERPYAGWSYANYSVVMAFSVSYLRLGLDVGVMGPASQAGDIQNWFHSEITGDPELQGWVNQLPNQLGVNIRGSYGFEVLEGSSFDIYSTIEVSIGNIYINTRPMIHFRLGKFVPIQNSVGQDNQLLGSKQQVEFYFDTGFGAKVSAFNATIQGNLFNNDSLFEQDEINNLVFNGYFGFCFLKNRTSIEFKYHLATGELKSSEINRYASLSFAQRF
ncbi:lipid A-modifier LpxR family protein [Winogradskyella sp.]|uniref:lipid A-modifier LpxR family protein n=1 Tax=Winogradskyella sp. TaxID=1883156 RepID=UPI002632144D|nr:lipid A-modifier LpxR family protein [Winogradskyella sp.]